MRFSCPYPFTTPQRFQHMQPSQISILSLVSRHAPVQWIHLTRARAPASFLIHFSHLYRILQSWRVSRFHTRPTTAFTAQYDQHLSSASDGLDLATVGDPVILKVSLNPKRDHSKNTRLLMSLNSTSERPAQKE